MVETIRTRLARVSETLKDQHIHLIIDLGGSTGIEAWDRLHFEQQALAHGAPGRYVAAVLGHQDEHGGYWDQHDRLRYRIDRSCAGQLRFRYSLPACARALTDALAAQGFLARWTGEPGTSVVLHLETELEPVR